ncbi:N-acetylmuramoyl-L-alanine amidase [Hyphomonas sp.]|uniref:N-acetylmuramoyl-L-alanine amidase family protein n=1 Tax=Hyphomonas sp. TaxID=87 RepID=UPI0025C3214F|nr:N-acetylmuramoyl-L-alanine amidase [Hyphomonas sp.]MBI1398757.1 N-acetylmuramoyl-L-alanine amidase [Hyphomonas sp.]
MTKFLSILLIILGFTSLSPAIADVTQVRIVGDGAPTRITLWTDTAESADGLLTEGNGERKVVLLLAQNGYSAAGEGNGGVESWSLEPGRLEFTLDRPMAVTRMLRLPPTGKERAYRVILDLDTISPTRYTVAARRDTKKLAKLETQFAEARADAKKLAGAATATRKATGPRKHVIVIDAGHGGKDPGALAVNGGKERDITLKAALALRDILEQTGKYEVRLTRDTDVFVEHEDRVTMARNWGAELFISLHADAAGSASVAGASVYTISARGETRIDRESSRNDWKIAIEDGTPGQLNGLLEDLVKRETKTRSAEFAELLLPELAAAGPVLRNTHRNAGYYVLLAPDVPAVLVELGFVTNADDAKRLQSEKGRKAAVTAIASAIDAYFDQQDLRLASN